MTATTTETRLTSLEATAYRTQDALAEITGGLAALTDATGPVTERLTKVEGRLTQIESGINALLAFHKITVPPAA